MWQDYFIFSFIANRKMELNKLFWEQRYEHQQTGWDLGIVSPPLKAYFDQLTNKDLRIFIPGAGNAHEAIYLLENGFSNITVIDIAPTPIAILKSKCEREIDNGKLKLICGDFFAHHGEYDLVVEQTFFCAINPDLRKKYAEKMATLLASNGKLIGVMFDKIFEGGPPFGGSSIEYETYFKPLFASVYLAPCYNSAKPRADSEVFVMLKK
jgi:hypothetical protein